MIGLVALAAIGVVTGIMAFVQWALEIAVLAVVIAAVVGGIAAAIKS
jgi:hypothetical protein